MTSNELIADINKAENIYSLYYIDDDDLKLSSSDLSILYDIELLMEAVLHNCNLFHIISVDKFVQRELYLSNIKLLLFKIADLHIQYGNRLFKICIEKLLYKYNNIYTHVTSNIDLNIILNIFIVFNYMDAELRQENMSVTVMSSFNTIKNTLIP